jgi:predicted ester cyclase
MNTQLEKNKNVVTRFNKEVIENGNLEIFKELMHAKFINHSAPTGTDNTSQGMINTFNTILRPGMPDLKVAIHEQIAEGELVTTRKSITGTHTGILLEIPPTGKQINIEVIDIVRIKDGKYFEHWGINTFHAVLQQLKAAL